MLGGICIEDEEGTKELGRQDIEGHDFFEESDGHHGSWASIDVGGEVVIVFISEESGCVHASGCEFSP